MAVQLITEVTLTDEDGESLVIKYSPEEDVIYINNFYLERGELDQLSEALLKVTPE